MKSGLKKPEKVAQVSEREIEKPQRTEKLERTWEVLSDVGVNRYVHGKITDHEKLLKESRRMRVFWKKTTEKNTEKKEQKTCLKQKDRLNY